MPSVAERAEKGRCRVLTEAETSARKACEALIRRTTVLLVADRKPQGEPEWGSGVLFQNSRGVPFVLTARHLFCNDDWSPKVWRPLSIGVPALKKELVDSGASVTFAPGRTREKPIDVAIVAINADLHDQLRPLAVGIERVGRDDATDPSDVLLMCGFPGFLAYPQGNLRQVGTISYSTGVTGRDRWGRLEVYWDEAIPYEGSPTPPHLDLCPGKVSHLGHPGGISGGGVWRVRGAKKGDLIWSPSSHADLIGVPVSFDSRRTQYAESVDAWGPWLIETAERLT